MPKSSSKNTNSAVDVQDKKPKRRLKVQKRHWYNPLTWHRSVPPPPRKPISSARELLQKSVSLLLKERMTFFTITMFYFLALFVFVRGFNIVAKDLVEFIPVGSGVSGAFQSSASRFGAIMSGLMTTDSAVSAVYQVIVTTIMSLALLWALRKVVAKKPVSVRDSFYKGMTPLVPYLLVIGIFSLILIPSSIAGFIYSNLLAGGLLISLTERIIAAGLFASVLLISLYFIIPSPFALIGATLPDVRPLHAYRSARAMVYKRRLLIGRKFIGAAIYMLLVAVVVLLPFLMWLPYFAPWIMLMLITLFLVVFQTFAYVLYLEALYGKDS